MHAFLQILGRLTAPVLLLLAGFAGVFAGGFLPPALAGLGTYGPWFVLGLGVALAIVFRRGGAAFALLTLLVACGAQQRWLTGGLADPEARSIYLALTVFVPLNLALFGSLPERGLFNRHTAWRPALIVLEVGLTGWLVAVGAHDWLDRVWRARLPVHLGLGAMPPVGTLTAVLALVGALTATVLSRTATSAACAGAIVAFVIAVHVPAARWTGSVFVTAAGFMLIMAVLQDAFRMAFRDELTGLPSRRALAERLASLPRRYAVAMVDLDHFKQFNDRWGHDTGDHVLRMVAAHIADVGGGGRAFRYGGEEFAIVFPGKGVAQAAPHLEALRRRVATYELAMRGPGRSGQPARERRRPGGWKRSRTATVTISAGIAESSDACNSPEAVLDAADRALYRAKTRGRNCICT